MDHDTLLAPLAGDSPCGEDLSFSPEFDAIGEARRADDATLSQGEWVTALKVADWAAVRHLCTDILALRSKDLRVAGWLTEARAHLDGHAGLADGLALCRGLCERHWDALHPRPDDDGDDEPRAGALRWLLGQVGTLACALPVLRDGGCVWSLRDIDAARTGRRAAAAASGGDDDALAAACATTPSASIDAAFAGASRARRELDALQQTVDTRLGADGPDFAAARRALDEAVQALGRLAPASGRVPADQAAAPAPSAASTPPAGDPDGIHRRVSFTTDAAAGCASAFTAGAGHAGAPRTRTEALQRLREVAEYFRRTEPHSPVAYLAERAARWGEMPLHEWLRAVMKDVGALSHVEELLGIEGNTLSGG